MADLGAGTPLANIKSTTTQATTAPGFYTDYLTDIAKKGGTAAADAKYISTQPLQTQAYDLAKTSVGATNPYTTQAGTAITNALGTDISGAAQKYMDFTAKPLRGANTAIADALETDISGAAQKYMNLAAKPTYKTVQKYMNPYTQNVVDSIGALGNQNISQNLAPQTTAGIVGAGQFGSQRGANALAQNIANAGVGITGLQAGALQSGYAQALQAAQNQANQYGTLAQLAGAQAGAQGQLDLAGAQARQNQATIYNNLAQLAGAQAGAQGQLDLAGAQAAQNLGSGVQQFNLNDINALSTMGAQQQTNLQNEQLFPLQTLSTEANLLRGYNMPTSVTSTYDGPGQAGQYASSPLSQTAGLASIIGGLSDSSFGDWLSGAITKYLKPTP
jgi:hypothetical protein